MAMKSVKQFDIEFVDEHSTGFKALEIFCSCGKVLIITNKQLGRRFRTCCDNCRCSYQINKIPPVEDWD